MSDTTTTLPRDHTKAWEENGVKFTADISPCSWMYPGYGLQVEIKMVDQPDHIFRNLKKRFQECTVTDFDNLVAGHVLEPCNKPGCTRITFKDSKGGQYNKEGYCETCRVARITEEFDAAQKEEEAKEKRLDAKRKREGFTHKTIAWIHPSAGGDDYQIVVHSKGKMKDTQIKAMILRRGSRVTTDYNQIEL